MPYFNILVETSENTVVTEYEPVKKRSDSYQSEAELEQDPALAQVEELEASSSEKTPKKRKARATDAERFKGIPVEKEYLNLSEKEKNCPVCGTALKQIGEEFVRRELVFIPARLKVREYYSRNYVFMIH